MSFKTLVASTTSASAFAASGKFKIDQGIATLGATALAGAEEVDIEISLDDGATWQTFHDSSSPVKLTVAQPHTTLNSPGTYRVAKDATASACAVIATSRFFEPLPV